MTIFTRVSDSGSAAEAATDIVIEELGAFSLTAIRTGAGNLKLINWRTGGIAIARVKSVRRSHSGTTTLTTLPGKP